MGELVRQNQRKINPFCLPFGLKVADKMADKPKSCLPNKKYLSGKNHLGTIGAGGGGRTHTVSPPTDFESVSSANSNTPAYEQRYYYNCIAPCCQAGRRDLSFFKKTDFFEKIC